jgi:hypothetical protein
LREGRLVAIGGTGWESEGSARSAVWLSDNVLQWEQLPLDVGSVHAVTAGTRGWMIVGTPYPETGRTALWFSGDGATWDGPHAVSFDLHTASIGRIAAMTDDTILLIGSNTVLVGSIDG